MSARMGRGCLEGWLSCFRADHRLRMSLFHFCFTSLEKQVIYQPLLNVELGQLQPSPCLLASSSVGAEDLRNLRLLPSTDAGLHTSTNPSPNVTLSFSSIFSPNLSSFSAPVAAPAAGPATAPAPAQPHPAPALAATPDPAPDPTPFLPQPQYLSNLWGLKAPGFLATVS